MVALRIAALVAAVLTTGLIAGVFYAYAISVMPALAGTDDRTIVEVMQKVNVAILNPWFLAPFVGTVACTVLAAALHLGGAQRTTLVWILVALVLDIAAFAVTAGLNVPLNERLAAAVGRSEGAPLFVVSQKSLTGHAKGGAAAFQLIGLCQVLETGVVPPNRSLDCVDEKMREYPHLVWLREALRFGDRFPLKAGLVTSLGFGHVSGLLAVVHPQAFIQAIEPGRREEYQQRAQQRQLAGRQRIAEAMCGGAPLYERPADRRLGGDGTPATRVRQLEADVLLSPQARLGVDGTYRTDGSGCGTGAVIVGRLTGEQG
ncbi:DUF1772 domain-containing protein [Nocardia elegans]|uniref:anthrone oxygenase family protein n=1 Tax=Nocardia elegans TaxID=300029 RepID=UPI00226BD95B|nr:anthrone oxygenase family protein [Nocardia elegans]